MKKTIKHKRNISNTTEMLELLMMFSFFTTFCFYLILKGINI